MEYHSEGFKVPHIKVVHVVKGNQYVIDKDGSPTDSKQYDHHHQHHDNLKIH